MPSPKQIPRGMIFFFSRIFPVLFVLVGAGVLYSGARGIYLANESVNWPTADGRIENSSVQFHHSDKGGGTYHAEVLYSFMVAGETHSGNKVAFGDYGSSSPSHAQSIVNHYPKNMAVSVYYLGSDPDFCVLEPGLKAQAWFMPAIGLVFLVAGILMMIYLPRTLSKQIMAGQGTEDNTANRMP